VVALEDGLRFLCGEPCVAAFRAGERAHDPGRLEKRASGRAEDTTASRRLPRWPRPVAAPPAPAPSPPEPARFPYGGAVAAGAAVLLGLIDGATTPPVLALLCVFVAAVSALRTSAPDGKRAGLLVWTAGPLGAVLAGVAAVVARHADPGAWLAVSGAGLAALFTVLRAWLDGKTRKPVTEVALALTVPIPRKVRIPVRASHPTEVAEEEVPTDRVRAGEEVIAHKGDVVAVDGVVKAGEAEVLLFPGARTPTRRTIGDPLLAGARVLEGGVRLMVTRVGDDRALFRPLRFGQGTGPGAAKVARRAEQAARLGSIVAVTVAVGGLGLVDSGGGVAAQLAAAAAVLLGAPLLAARRSAEAPLVAAGAAAAARGVIFHDARTLEITGRVASCALCTHGTVTEGRPEVVEVHPLGGADPRTLMALAAAAETAAEGSAISFAIRRYAERHGIAPESVRRATFLAGRGVTALGPGGEPLVIGNRQLLLEEGVSVAVADEEATRAEAQGYTALFVGLGGRVRAVLALQDEVRPGARAAVQRVVDLAVEPVLLSGDHRVTVEALARNLDVAHVKAELLPEERGAEVRRLAEGDGVVAVVGHPRHDDAALAAAGVPIVLGAAGGPGGDRGVALATDDLRDAAGALWIARASHREAWQGVLLSVGVGGLVVAGAAIGWVHPALAALLGVVVDLLTLPSGARMLERIERRLPSAG
jgi:cation transport ATPase